jgi:hypothetical protein
LRDVIHVGGALVTAVCAVVLVGAVAHGESVRVVLARPLPNVDLAFVAEPLGALVAAAVCGLGVLHALHSAGVVRATREKAPARLMAFMALAAAATIAVAFSANLFTLFVAYQGLTLAVFPLVAHRGDEAARRAGRTFLATLLTASMGLFLPAMIWTYAITGALDFQPGGVLAGRVDVIGANILLVLFVLGLGMAAIPPLHRWLPVSSDAPHPALVTIQALAVLPAGGVGLIKVAAFVFGPALHSAQVAAHALIILAGGRGGHVWNCADRPVETGCAGAVGVFLYDPVAGGGHGRAVGAAGGPVRRRLADRGCRLRRRDIDDGGGNHGGDNCSPQRRRLCRPRTRDALDVRRLCAGIGQHDRHAPVRGRVGQALAHRCGVRRRTCMGRGAGGRSSGAYLRALGPACSERAGGEGAYRRLQAP